MSVSVRKSPTIIPTYSLTGDLLAYLRCPRQYRYYNKASLPPSTPVQLWFGEFIHGVMEIAFFHWRDDGWTNFPWDWEQRIKFIELEMHSRLGARGMKAPPSLFRRYREGEEPVRLIASYRTELAINTWGPHLFPMIDKAEVRLKGSRPMPSGIKHARSDYFSITGVVDVVSSFRLKAADEGNRFLNNLCQLESVQHRLETGTEPFDVIVDYKGMRRPPSSATDNSNTWHHQEWQILTYAWLRQQQEPDRNIVAGVVLYLNELHPADTDYAELIRDVKNDATDVSPTEEDLVACESLAKLKTAGLSTEYREKRSIRVIDINDDAVMKSLEEFGTVVGDVELAVAKETSGSTIVDAWHPEFDRDTCIACDFKYDCEKAKGNLKSNDLKPNVP